MAQSGAGRLFTGSFLFLSLADLAYFTGAGMLVTATPLLVTDRLGGGDTAVGVVFGAFSVTTLVLRPWAGRWSDRWGRRRLMLAGTAAFAVLVLGHLLVTGLVQLVVLRLLLGAAEALFFVAGFAMLADVAPAGRAGEALSYASLALFTGLAVGPPLAQALLRGAGFTPVWWAAALLAGAACLFVVPLPDTRSATAPGPPTASLLYRPALAPGVALMAGGAPAAGFLAFGVLYARNLGIERWSLVPFGYGATVVLCRVVFAKLPDRLPPGRVAVTSLAIATLALVILGGGRHPVGLVAGAVLLGLGTALLTPAIFALVFARAPAQSRGSAAATTSIFIDLGLTAGPVLVGLLAATASVPTAFLTTALLPLTGALVLTAGARRGRRPGQRDPRRST
jgi:MFS family permease